MTHTPRSATFGKPLAVEPPPPPCVDDDGAVDTADYNVHWQAAAGGGSRSGGGNGGYGRVVDGLAVAGGGERNAGNCGVSKGFETPNAGVPVCVCVCARARVRVCARARAFARVPFTPLMLSKQPRELDSFPKRKATAHALGDHHKLCSPQQQHRVTCDPPLVTLGQMKGW